MKHSHYVLTLLAIVLMGSASALASSPGSDVRLTNDFPGGGYVSAYTLATGNPYTDAVLNECSISRGRQNEPSVAVDPRDTNVLVGSSNDYCGVYSVKDALGNLLPLGPIWLGYYRSQDAGANFVSSLVPGYPGDTSPYAASANIRTSSAGDPVIAWDGHGRVYMGSESSGDPAGTKKTLGDVGLRSSTTLAAWAGLLPMTENVLFAVKSLHEDHRPQICWVSFRTRPPWRSTVPAEHATVLCIFPGRASRAMAARQSTCPARPIKDSPGHRLKS
jgi:hypothetical protein